MKIFLQLICLFCLIFADAEAQPPAPGGFSTSTLPLFVIDTHGGTIVDEPKITAELGIIDNGEGKTNTLTDPFTAYHGTISIEIRGSSSQQYPKKQYGFTTVTASGEDDDVSLLGFPSEHSWILNAPYTDKTMLRDALTYILSNQIGRYATRTKFCEVFVNEGHGLDYKGVYLLMEKIKRDKHRVNISKMTAADTTGDNLTGGYIFKIDKADKPTDRGWDATYPPFATAARRYLMYQYEYPDIEEIMPQQMDYLKAYVKNFETLMASASYTDPLIGYPSCLDVSSFVDLVIMNELAKNVDGYRLSTFLCKDRASVNDKLFAGPLWDFNLGYGNVNYDDAYLTSGWELDYQSRDVGNAFAAPFWWKKLWADPAFKMKTAVRWKELRTQQLSMTNIFSVMDSLVAVIGEAQQRNYERWPIIGTYVWPNYYYRTSSYADEVTWMKAWLIRRLEWLDRAFAPLEVGVNDIHLGVPLITVLEQNYPNPFNPSTTLRYSTDGMRHVTISVFDMLGRRCATLVNSVTQPGTHTIIWDASGMPGGVYFCRMQSGSYITTIRMSVLK